MAPKLLASSEDASNDAKRFSLAFSQYLETNYAGKLWHCTKKGDPHGPTIYFPGSCTNKKLWWKINQYKMTLELMNEYQGSAKNLKLPIEFKLDQTPKCDYLFVALKQTVKLSDTFESQITIIEQALSAAQKLIDIAPLIKPNAESVE